MEKSFISEVCSPTQMTEPSLWFIFQGENILLEVISGTARIPQFMEISALNFTIDQQCYLGIFDGTPCFAVQVNKSSPHLLPGNMEFQHVRQSYSLLNDEDLFSIVAKAKQILHWDKITRFCGYCGQHTEASLTERAKKCKSCDTMIFPQLSPAMLVLIYRDNEILLGRSSYFLPGIYSILAGFVEPGETLEHAVKREAKEEVGITIKNLRYCGSQPWPFPSNLMLGFVAEYEAGEIKFDSNELEDAQWFPINKLPNLPSAISLSRRIIDDYVTSKK